MSEALVKVNDIDTNPGSNWPIKMSLHLSYTGYYKYPFLNKWRTGGKQGYLKEKKVADRVCLSRWASWGASDARRFL